MDALHTVLRSIRRETKSRRDHLTVFREFLDHLDRAAKTQPVGRKIMDRQPKMPKGKARRGKR